MTKIYKESVLFGDAEIAALKREADFKKVYSLPNGFPIYPHIRIREHGMDYSRHISADTYIIKESNGVLYLWRVSENAYKVLSSNNYYTDTFCNDYTEKSLKDLEILKLEIENMCLRKAEMAIDLGVIAETENAKMQDMYGHPLFERLDKYVTTYDTQL